MESSPNELKYDTLNLLQFIFEIAVIAGYVIALIPGLYFITFIWVVPLTIANLAFSLIKENETLPYTATNVAMGFITFLPLVGYLSIIAGIVMSVLSALKVSKLMQVAPTSNKTGSTVEVIASKAKITEDDKTEKPSTKAKVEKPDDKANDNQES